MALLPNLQPDDARAGAADCSTSITTSSIG
jgi:hypothetical protein